MVQVNNLTSHHHQQQQQPCASHASWDAALGRQDIELLLDEETRLLSQLTSVAPPNTLDLRGAFDVGVQTIAPPQDPMFYYKRFAFRPPMVNAATMDCQQIGEVMRKAALQIGVSGVVNTKKHCVCVASQDATAGLTRRLSVALSQVVDAYAHLVHSPHTCVLAVSCRPHTYIRPYNCTTVRMTGAPAPPAGPASTRDRPCAGKVAARV